MGEAGSVEEGFSGAPSGREVKSVLSPGMLSPANIPQPSGLSEGRMLEFDPPSSLPSPPGEGEAVGAAFSLFDLGVTSSEAGDGEEGSGW
jgi:hypothetical protein